MEKIYFDVCSPGVTEGLFDVINYAFRPSPVSSYLFPEEAVLPFTLGLSFVNTKMEIRS